MLIGFNGNMGVGKSTAIQALKDYVFPREVHLVKFAQPLYDMQEFIYRRISSVHTRPDSFTKDRKLLQWLGTDWGRDTISQDLWVSIWKAQVESIRRRSPDSIIVCDDVRFDNEAETLKSLGGHIIKIERPDNTLHAQGGVGIVGHKSEAGVSESLLDFTVRNNSTLEYFEANLVLCFETVNKKAA